MGVLKNLTEEYFGNKIRKEDVIFRYSIDENFPPEHTLTQDEESFLQGLARHKLFLEKSKRLEVPTAEGNLKVLFDHIPEARLLK